MLGILYYGVICVFLGVAVTGPIALTAKNQYSSTAFYEGSKVLLSVGAAMLFMACLLLLLR